MFVFLRASMVSLLFTLLLLALLPATALAHERRTVGNYQFVVGFFTEPAFEGQPNAVSVRITNAEATKPVEGLEKTLRVELSAGGQKKGTDLRPVFRDPGHYRADFIPTLPGTYVFTFTGTIEGTAISERFESGPGRFNDVQAAEELQFPVKVPSALSIRTDSMQAARDAQKAADSARTVGIIGIIVGSLGLLVGAGSLAMAMRKKGQ